MKIIKIFWEAGTHHTILVQKNRPFIVQTFIMYHLHLNSIKHC